MPRVFEDVAAELISDERLSAEQIEIIKNAFSDNIPVEQIKLFNKPEFSVKQMEILVFGFLRKLPAELYCDHNRPFYQMVDLTHCFLNKTDPSWLLSAMDLSHMI